MNILVLGRGLLGSHLAKLYPHIPVLTHAECDITNPHQIDRVIHQYNPEVIVNSAGIVPRHVKYPSNMDVLKINAQGPRLLANACDEYGCKLIQISSDCVYSGQRGQYTEVDIPNPTDLYGMSKYLGEVTEYPHLVIRTSFVGFPDIAGRGLLQWAFQQTKITGYDSVYWNGLTAVELSRQLIETIIPKGITHLIHLYGETLSKYQVLEQAKEIFGWAYELIPESSSASTCHAGNRTLASEMEDFQVKKPFKQMLQEMKNLWTINEP